MGRRIVGVTFISYARQTPLISGAPTRGSRSPDAALGPSFLSSPPARGRARACGAPVVARGRRYRAGIDRRSRAVRGGPRLCAMDRAARGPRHRDPPAGGDRPARSLPTGSPESWLLPPARPPSRPCAWLAERRVFNRRPRCRGRGGPPLRRVHTPAGDPAPWGGPTVARALNPATRREARRCLRGPWPRATAGRATPCPAGVAGAQAREPVQATSGHSAG